MSSVIAQNLSLHELIYQNAKQIHQAKTCLMIGLVRVIDKNAISLVNVNGGIMIYIPNIYSKID